MNCVDILYSNHVLNAMIARSIRTHEIEEVIQKGEIIKFYSDDKPYPSYLLLKFVSGRPIHVVMAQSPETGNCIVITCYEPDPLIWLPDFKHKNEFL